jgi:hypothetical protein
MFSHFFILLCTKGYFLHIRELHNNGASVHVVVVERAKSCEKLFEKIRLSKKCDAHSYTQKEKEREKM